MVWFAAYWWIIIFVTDGLMGPACRDWGLLLTKKRRLFFETRVIKVEKEVVFCRFGSLEFSKEAFRMWGI